MLILEMYSKYFNPGTENQHPRKSVNVIRHKSAPGSNLAQGFRRPVVTIVASRDIRNQFLIIRSRRARLEASSISVWFGRDFSTPQLSKKSLARLIIHCTIHVRDSADLKNKQIYPDGSYGLFVTCGQKNRISYTCTHMSS
jgi:hypothetical protein